MSKKLQHPPTRTVTKNINLDVKVLAKILESYHSKECWNQTKNWFDQFGKNNDERAKFLEQIIYSPNGPFSHTADLGVDHFSVLQGDIIKTKAALTNHPVFDYKQEDYSYYIVIPSSCSVQPRKYKWVLLARLQPLESDNINAIKNIYFEALNFKNNKLFFLPAIEGVDVGEYGFLAVLEEISYIDNSLLQTCIRLTSLSTLGWHLFNAFLVNHFTRPSGDDLKIRNNNHPSTWSWTQS